MIIYKATNVKNNKVYIGKTIKSLEARWIKHLWMADKKTNRYFYDAINYYGKENFLLEEIDNAVTVEELNEKEKEIYQAKIEFFTNVAHEIKTPLTLIKSPLEKLLKFEYETPEIPQNLSIMRKNTSRLLKLVNELLDFRKTEIGGLKLTFVEANISSMVRSMHLRFSQLIEEKNIDFELELSEKDIYAFVDKEALKKIMSNLFNNAIKYSENKVIVSLIRDEKKLKLIVKNDGNLIPSHLKDKIFEPFFRVENMDNNSGTGIGLSLAQSLTQLHNGSLQLIFSEAEMNVFELIMPLHQEEEFMLYDEQAKDLDANENKVTEPENKSEKTTILVVEDNEDLLQFITKELLPFYIVFNANNINRIVFYLLNIFMMRRSRGLKRMFYFRVIVPGPAFLARY